eukprot:TRINITY_DN6051_c0_g1_i3.p1 TRINITY_DN6051_c0_g1~~TRINITY_DN6051_c0_g1_i3.p1  ORF type:complete len:405 (-),score=90.86 TRINITY_DN6051_c0_g1_i3:159-1373(-)
MNSKQAVELKTEDKRIWFGARMAELKKSIGRIPGFQRSDAITLLIERSHFLRDSFEQLRTRTDLDLRGDVRIHYLDECCQDAGGLFKEWLTVLTGELLSPKLGLFVKTKTPQVAYIINVNSDKCCAKHLDYFYFCGQIFAKALFENVAIKAYLCKPLLKQLVGLKSSREDLKYIDTELWRSMEYLSANKIEGDVGNFTVTEIAPVGNKSITVELKKDGRNVAITEKNKAEFIDLACKYYLSNSTKTQRYTLAEGFFSLIPKEITQALDCDELELFLCGDSIISIEDWKANTRYAGNYNKDHQVVRWFWEVLSQLSGSELESFLHFCTGSNRVPAEGFAGLTSNNGKRSRFVVESREFKGNGTDFVVAHTCFNKVEVPEYRSVEEMRKAIKTIISTPICYQFSFE